MRRASPADNGGADMSEYQYYEFRAIDRALSKEEMAALRRISSRAEINSRSFVNTYNYGDLKAEPLELMERYFDVFTNVANWGTHWYNGAVAAGRGRSGSPQAGMLPGPTMMLHERGEFAILEFQANDESGESSGWEEGEEWMPELIGLREEIAGGDLRAAYLAWLSGVYYGELEDEAPEPPVPAGLGSLTPSLESFVEFMRVRDDLLDLARERSGLAVGREPADEGFADWVRALPATEKDDLLIAAVNGETHRLGSSLRRRYQREHGPVWGEAVETGRTAGELFAAAEEREEERERIEEAKRAEVAAKQAAAQAKARETYLDGLATRVDGAWREAEGMVESKKPTEYDRAVRLITDLRDLADRDGEIDEFWGRLRTLRDRHAKKVSFMGRLDEAGLEG